MIWRWLLAVLIALNIGVAGWVVFEYHARVLPPLADPGIPLLELLSTPGQATAPAPGTSSGISERHGQDAGRK